MTGIRLIEIGQCVTWLHPAENRKTHTVVYFDDGHCVMSCWPGSSYARHIPSLRVEDDKILADIFRRICNTSYPYFYESNSLNMLSIDTGVDLSPDEIDTVRRLWPNIR